MAASVDKKQKCATVIPANWPKLTSPAYTRGMTAEQGRKAWFDFLREQAKVTPTPRIPRSSHD